MSDDLIVGGIFLLIFAGVALDYFINRKRRP